MKLKLDENLPVSLAPLLTARGYDVDTVQEENLVGARDPDVLAAAGRDDRLVITMDRGFGDVRTYPPGSHAGIVVVRPDDGSAEAVLVSVQQLVDYHDLGDLAGTVTVVRRGILRVRRPHPSSEMESLDESG